MLDIAVNLARVKTSCGLCTGLCLWSCIVYTKLLVLIQPKKVALRICDTQSSYSWIILHIHLCSLWMDLSCTGAPLACVFYDLRCVVYCAIFPFVRCFAHACESFFLPLIGPLVFPGPLFMNQREQALARLRPLQAIKLMREKLKGTMVFTSDSTWSPAAPDRKSVV